jgi:hypothetical protein
VLGEPPQVRQALRAVLRELLVDPGKRRTVGEEEAVDDRRDCRAAVRAVRLAVERALAETEDGEVPGELPDLKGRSTALEARGMVRADAKRRDSCKEVLELAARLCGGLLGGEWLRRRWLCRRRWLGRRGWHGLRGRPGGLAVLRRERGEVDVRPRDAGAAIGSCR